METGFAAAERQQSFRGPRGEGAIVFDPTRVPQATPDLLEPAWWGDAAVPVASGGRGAAWFVRGAFGDGVLRRYRRGGVVLPGICSARACLPLASLEVLPKLCGQSLLARFALVRF